MTTGLNAAFVASISAGGIRAPQAPCRAGPKAGRIQCAVDRDGRSCMMGEWIFYVAGP
jgi:hypothetical protein